MAFDYAKLPREFPRRYLPAGMGFEWAQLSRPFDELKGREIRSAEDLKRWLADQDELDAVVYERKALLMVNVSRQTDDAGYKKAYMDFLQSLEPRIKVSSFELLKKYVASPYRKKLPSQDYGMLDRRRESAARIFREENVELEKKDAEVTERYQSIMGAMTVSFRGEERTLQQMSRFYEETDRGTRREAWELSQARLLKDSERLDLVYDEMIGLRDRIARNAGFSNFRDYVFVHKNRFDYTPEDCTALHDAVEKYFVPLSREIDEERKRRMGLDELMPWDMIVDPDGRPPLAPFDDIDGLVGGCSKVLKKVDGQLSKYFDRMVKLDLLDLDSRKGKAPGGFQEEFSELRFPFIFMNAAKKDSDMRTLLHESGHSFQTFLMREAGLKFYNAGLNLPLEFAEVASTSMELMGGEHLEGTFYNGADARRSNKIEVIDMVKLFTWVATIDSFQHWVYTHPGHTHEERAAAWAKTFRRYSGLESYEGLEQQLRYRWQRQLHIYQFPFYYIEYLIATLGALGIWFAYREDRAEAIGAYKRALSLGATRPLPELFQAAGLPWDLGPRTLEKYARQLGSVLKTFS
ncbi:MAG: M3 family oligoendopeptidase [Nitrososphaerales archaeon]